MPASSSQSFLLEGKGALLGAAAAMIALSLAVAICTRRMGNRRGRGYVRLSVVPYRGEDASAEAVVAMFEALHKRLLVRWWRRLLRGQPSIALEVHLADEACLAVSCPAGLEQMVLSALRVAYPNCRLERFTRSLGEPPALLRLKKQQLFIKRVKAIDRFEHEREPFVNRLLRTMAASGGDAFMQLAMTPAPVSFERHAKRMYRRHEKRVSRERGEGVVEPRLDRSMVEDAELRGGLEVQHRPLYFVDVRVVAATRVECERVASALRAEVAENRLVERGTAVRHGLLRLYTRRVVRGEGNPLPSTRKGVYASTELAEMWQLPSLDFLAVPLRRSGIPIAPASAGIMRPADGIGTLRDAYGPVCIHPTMRRQNTAVVGTVEQGKSSYLVASAIEDLRRSRCAVILLDPKGDAADAALSHVPAARKCTLLDLANPTCGFNPMAVDAPADVIADYVVAALKGLFTDSDIRASSDRYLRNAIIAVIAYDRRSTLWDAARLLSVGHEGYDYRARVGACVREMPELKEISDFFTAELSAQLADARSATTAKLDAPVNKLARLLNSPTIKRVLLNDSLRVDFDQIICGGEVLIVKGALGGMGAGNTAVLMQLLVGMLDAALARQQDLVAPADRIAVALKVDEAPLVLNRGFAETMALKRSAGLETVACWQTDAQWLDRDVRDQLDALFAHRVYFATASVEDARASARLMMAQFSDQVRPRLPQLSTLGRPDARLHLPKHHAIACWSTPSGRQPPFVAQTLALHVDHDRLAWHLAQQGIRGGRYLDDLSMPHWDRRDVPPLDKAAIDDSAAKEPAKKAVAMAPVARARSPEELVDGDMVAREGVARERVASEGAASEGTASEGAAREAAAGVKAASEAAVGGPAAETALQPLPDVAALSYRELVALDSASKVRAVPRASAPRQVKLDARDFGLLSTIATFRHVLSSQLHLRHGAGTAITGTQRRLKRLADAGLIERVQFHGQDGGGAPMCCTITPAGLQQLAARMTPWHCERASASAADAPGEPSTHSTRVARRDVHAAAWAFALERRLAMGPLRAVGPHQAPLSPPLRSDRQGRAAIGPAQLRLGSGRVPHNFLRTGMGSELHEIETFETVRPALQLEVTVTAGASAPLPARDIAASGHGAADAVDLLVELDDRQGLAAWHAKVQRYDHFLAGWSAHLRRYRHEEGEPFAVFVCRDRRRARECTRRADALLLASRAYAGAHPADWLYPGRERIFFVAERDLHEGLLEGYVVHRLPPQVRLSAAGDHRLQAAAVQVRSLPLPTKRRGR